MQWRPQVFLSFASKLFFQQMKQTESKVIWTNLKITPEYLEKNSHLFGDFMVNSTKKFVGLQRLDGQKKIMNSKRQRFGRRRATRGKPLRPDKMDEN